MHFMIFISRNKNCTCGTKEMKITLRVGGGKEASEDIDYPWIAKLYCIIDCF